MTLRDAIYGLGACKFSIICGNDFRSKKKDTRKIPHKLKQRTKHNFDISIEKTHFRRFVSLKTIQSEISTEMEFNFTERQLIICMNSHGFYD